MADDIVLNITNMSKKNQISLNNSFTKFLLYTTPNGKVKVEIFLRDENIWLTQAKIAELFDTERSVVTKHLRNIYFDGELDKVSTCAKFAQVQNEGNRAINRELEFYNLDAIISVGYCNDVFGLRRDASRTLYTPFLIHT